MHGIIYPDLDPTDHITPRQRQILIFLVRGNSRELIARELYVSRSTVNREVQTMAALLGASSPEALGALAYREGILEDGHLI